MYQLIHVIVHNERAGQLCLNLPGNLTLIAWYKYLELS